MTLSLFLILDFYNFSVRNSVATSDFTAFKDWNINGPEGDEDFYWKNENSTNERNNAIHRNIQLLLSKNAWDNKVKEFEVELAKIIDIKKRIKKSRVRDSF